MVNIIFEQQYLDYFTSITFKMLDFSVPRAHVHGSDLVHDHLFGPMSIYKLRTTLPNNYISGFFHLDNITFFFIVTR